MKFSAEDHARIAGAIADAEARTSGEIYCIVTTEAHRYTGFALALAAFTAFALPFGLAALGFGPSAWLALVQGGGWLADADLSDWLLIEIYACVQLGLFLAVAALLLLTPLSQHLAPRSVRRERVHDVALHQFLAKGLHATADRTGVLIFLSTRDRVAEVVADQAIYARVPSDHWGDTLAALLSGVKRGDPAAGFVAAIALAGAVLAEHFPPTAENPNELEDRLVEI